MFKKTGLLPTKIAFVICMKGYKNWDFLNGDKFVIISLYNEHNRKYYIPWVCDN